MNKTMIRVLSLVCVMLMLVGTIGLVACQDGGNGGVTTGDTTTADPNSGDTTTADPDGTTTGSNAEENKPSGVDVTWLKNFDEKRTALANPFGRTMSIAWGGDSVNYPAGSKKAVTEAIEMGADAIGVYVKATKDNVLVVVPDTSLYSFTNFKDIKGTNGLPTGQAVSAWTWEQLQELRYLKADGTASNRKIMDLETLVGLCKDKCFIYIKNCTEFSDNNYKVLYDIANKTEGYSAFMLSPGVKAISVWATKNSGNAKLTSFIMAQKSLFYHQKDYFDVRKTFGLGSTKYSDDEKGYKNAYSDQYNLLITNNVYELTQWIAKNQKSALEYTPTVHETLKHSIAKEDLTARYFIVTDTHYTPVEDAGYQDRVTYRGYSTVERMNKLCAEIEAEYKARGLDAIVICGDLTTDDPPHRNTGIWLDDLYIEYLNPLSEKLGIPILAVGGNHDGHINAMWKQYTGNDREFVWENSKTGDVFIMVDTFNPATTPANQGGSGVSFSGNNEAWIEQQLEKYKDRKNVFICSHKFSGDMTELINLVAKYDNVKALFDGHSHTHSAQKLKNETVDAGAYWINIGNYAYGDWGYGKPCGPTFDYHDERNVWGYNIVEISDSKTITYRVDVEAFYCAKYSSSGKLNVRIYQPFTKNAEIELK